MYEQSLETVANFFDMLGKYEMKKNIWNKKMKIKKMKNENIKWKKIWNDEMKNEKGKIKFIYYNILDFIAIELLFYWLKWKNLS